MVATVVLGMLCVHLLCFCVMFYLISTRLPSKKMGMEVFALGNFLLGCAYIFQLITGPAQWGVLSIINHTLTLCAPVVYMIGATRFFNRPIPLWRPLFTLAIGYSGLQILVQWTLGDVAPHALLAASCALLFFAISTTALYASRTFAKDLKLEMWIFAAFIGGLSILNAAKLGLLVTGGLEALNMSSAFQTVFYLYMSFLGTVLPPSIVWLVLRRLTDDLRVMASQDPLTQLLNRRGLTEGLEAYFRSKEARTAHLLMVDLDHFKQINDAYGHKVGDMVLCHVARVLQGMTRAGDLTCRLGGEEFVVICLDTDELGALQLAERTRAAIASSEIFIAAHAKNIRCTATIGVSRGFTDAEGLETGMQEADSALYRGKKTGRNRVEGLSVSEMPLAPPIAVTQSNRHHALA